MRRSLLLCGAVLAGLSGVAPRFAVAQVAGGEGRVLVLPFATASGTGSEWMGRAVQQDLLADLTQGTTARVVAPSSVPAATDEQGAVKAAREAGASIVVFGQAQASGKDVRITGQVIDVATATPLGAIKATGPSDELFHLEDALAGQIFATLPRTLLTAQASQGIEQPQRPAPVNPLAKPQEPAPVAVNPLARPDPTPQPQPASVEAPQVPAETPPHPVVPPAQTVPEPQLQPQPAQQEPLSPYVSTQADSPPPAAPDGTPVVVNGGDVAAPPPASYPASSYDYGNTPVYDYSTPAYSYVSPTYVSPGCYSYWPGIVGGICIGGGGYGCYSGYVYHGGCAYHGVYPHYGYIHSGYVYPHGWDHHDVEHHEWDHHDSHGEGDHPNHGGGGSGGGREPARAVPYQFAGAGNAFSHADGATFAPAHSEYRSGGYSRPSYLSPGGMHVSSAEGLRGGSAGFGATHGYAGASHNSSGGGSHSSGGGEHSSGGGGSSHGGGGGHH
jgi:TolB-like protein